MSRIDLTCIIDDDPIFVFGARRIMEMADFCSSFMIFKNGKDALDNLKPILESGRQLPDIILLDINMPIMDGWEFLDEFIKIECNQEITIYIVSSSIDPMDMKRVENYENVSNYIVKPISPDTLNIIKKDFA
ncbi:response regulator [Winogradskyella maritima]|uniref:Response regulator n=1 Tax=Winogradskyella maritima TaxID=1517766 RepID=A0ABV8AG89_9FLAO|nr:response regulator [Winogradskyella maritima]